MTQDKRGRLTNLIIAIIAVVILMLFTGINFDCYYDLNDDVLMKDILSGAYTGVPESRNIQMLWLLGFIISLLYRISGRIPWYGLFLCFCQLAAAGIIVYRTLCTADKITAAHQKSGNIINNEGYNNGRYIIKKILIAAAELGLVIALMLKHMVFVQYTITVAFISGAAIVWFMTNDSEQSFIKRNIPAIVMLFIAFLLRSEMLLLMLPFVCVAGICKWGCEEKFFIKENFVKYFSLFGIILLSLGFGYLSNSAAYGSAEWREFTDLFNARTELYDFRNIPEYEGNENLYKGLGLKKTEAGLLENYNYALSDNIDAEKLWKVASYAEKAGKAEGGGHKLKEKLKLYIYELVHIKGAGTDFPYNIAAFILYVVALVSAFKCMWKPALLFFVRSAVWLYILMGGRAPERITHSLYFIELCVLLGIILTEALKSACKKDVNKGICGKALYIILLVIIIFILSTVGRSLNETKDEYIRREEINLSYNELFDYERLMLENAGAGAKKPFYVMDVYSSVDYSEKMFKNVGNSWKNTDIAGGWACFSPLYEKKLLEAAGKGASDKYVSLSSLLLTKDIYFVTDKEYDLDWLTQLYSELYGMKVRPELVYTVADKFEIYRILPV